MQLSHEYNEFLVGLVVTDKETGRAVNFQHEQVQSNHPEASYKLAHNELGDDDSASFSVAEMDVIKAYVRSLPNTATLEDEYTAIMHAPQADELKEILRTNGCVYPHDIIRLAEEVGSYHYAVPVGHTEAQDLIERFNSAKDAIEFCGKANDEIVINDFGGDSDKWRNDGHSITWLSMTERELIDSFPKYLQSSSDAEAILERKLTNWLHRRKRKDNLTTFSKIKQTMLDAEVKFFIAAVWGQDWSKNDNAQEFYDDVATSIKQRIEALAVSLGAV